MPGNDDSGALSAWYAWNAVGLFPVPGQGNLSARQSDGRTRRADHRRGVADDLHGCGRPRLNGHDVDRTWLRYDEVLEGARLDLRLGSDPNRFGPLSLPPSSS